MKKIGLILLLFLTSNTYSETINSHILPPEPDPQINNSTLLGIDSNNNGVRDDVERWIYKTYNDPVERGIFMQSARAYQKVIVDPSKALNTKQYLRNVSSCEYYLLENDKKFAEKYSFNYLLKELRKIQFNTNKRHMAHERYQGELSGGVYPVSPADKTKCEFDEYGILKEFKQK
jgi:hypothetical protein